MINGTARSGFIVLPSNWKGQPITKSGPAIARRTEERTVSNQQVASTRIADPDCISVTQITNSIGLHRSWTRQVSTGGQGK
ncbi:MAG: hypothetical protein IPN48_05700 [Sphingomonadales bacterium]|nr:hypothetical protein [Sphingomonadales bacterium]